MNHLFRFCFSLLVFICIGKTYITAQSSTICIKTTMGEIEAEIYLKEAPVTASNFLNLMNAGVYDNGATFYRVTRADNQPDQSIKIDVVQGGLRSSNDTSLAPIRHETTQETGLKHIHGSLSMARSKPGSASSEFFICIEDQPELDYGGKRNPDGMGFAVFGQVTKGMDVVYQIQQLPNQKQLLIEPVRIISIQNK